MRLEPGLGGGLAPDNVLLLNCMFFIQKSFKNLTFSSCSLKWTTISIVDHLNLLYVQIKH